MPHPADKILDQIEALLTRLRDAASRIVYLGSVGYPEDLDIQISALRKLRFDYDRMVDLWVEDNEESDEEELSELTAKAFNDLVEAEVAKRLALIKPPTE